tara:strand:+ start:1498 stop:2310 length:813 start_codon:yes stop_codon:yes gene_type:complete
MIRKAKRLAKKALGWPEIDFSRYMYASPTPPDGLLDVPLGRYFWENEGRVIDKWLHYFERYERHFAPYRGRPGLRFLEIGVQNGGSQAMWREYFGPEAVIYGIDIDPRCAELDGEMGQVRIGSQDDPAFLRKVVEEMGGIDVVLDDGSHRSDHIRTSFRTLFPLMADGGSYMIEDLHSVYWPQWKGGYRTRRNFMSDIADLIDDMHEPYHLKGRLNPSCSEDLAGVHVYDSIAVLEKKAHAAPRRTSRGRTEIATSGFAQSAPSDLERTK